MNNSQRRATIKLIAQAGLRYANERLDTFKISGDGSDRKRRIVQRLVDWVNEFGPDDDIGNISLIGSVGTGKDHLAFGVAWALIVQQDISVEWVNGRDMVGRFRDQIDDGGRESTLIAEYTTPTLLVISDPLPVAGEFSNYQADIFYRIIDKRSRSMRSTIVTCNVADEEHAKKRFGVPTWNRLEENSIVCVCRWTSHRKRSEIIK